MSCEDYDVAAMAADLIGVERQVDEVQTDVGSLAEDVDTLTVRVQQLEQLLQAQATSPGGAA